MAGRKQFNEEDALEKAMHCFWHYGCSATSMSELEQATGLNKSSLYNAYGSKSALLDKCLEHFSRNFTGSIFATLSNPDIKDAIHGLTGALAKRFENSDLPTGCLATMAALEEGGGDSTTAQLIADDLNQLQQKLTDRFQQAVIDGQLPVDTDTSALAASYLVLTRGLAVVHRGSGNAATIKGALKTADTLLEHPPRIDV